jgi:hypothetical protein
MKIRLVGAELFSADRQKDGRTQDTMPVVAFGNFEKAPESTL